MYARSIYIVSVSKEGRIMAVILGVQFLMMLQFHYMPTILGQTPLFLTRTLDVIMTSL